MFLAWFRDSKLSGSRKISKIVVYDKARVNGGINYDYPEQRWVPKLVIRYVLCTMLYFVLLMSFARYLYEEEDESGDASREYF